ncbi:MAG TPA: GNAT family N-acetyltransferase [Rubrivivax sp.]|nr:GNAT family N-acetyltransferase [Rubrivivax sp.]
MGDRIELRLGRAADAAGIARMSRELIEAGLGWSYDAPRVMRLIADRDTLTLVAADRLGLVGFAILQFGDERAHLVLLAVQPRRQRQGIARRLLGWLLESAYAAGIAELSLELRAGNAGARAFYRALGFNDAGLVSGYYRQREAALRMVRVLRRIGDAAPAWQAPTLRRS